MAEIAKITARQWNRYQNGRQRDNPILKGLQYLRVFEDESVRTYAKAAEILGVSRERVYQLTALVTKLPPQIKDFLADTEDPAVLRFFTERRLRPLTMIPDGEAQMAQFDHLLASVNASRHQELIKKELKNSEPLVHSRVSGTAFHAIAPSHLTIRWPDDRHLGPGEAESGVVP